MNNWSDLHYSSSDLSFDGPQFTMSSQGNQPSLSPLLSPLIFLAHSPSQALQFRTKMTPFNNSGNIHVIHASCDVGVYYFTQLAELARVLSTLLLTLLATGSCRSSFCLNLPSDYYQFDDDGNSLDICSPFITNGASGNPICTRITFPINVIVLHCNTCVIKSQLLSIFQSLVLRLWGKIFPKLYAIVVGIHSSTHTVSHQMYNHFHPFIY